MRLLTILGLIILGIFLLGCVDVKVNQYPAPNTGQTNEITESAKGTTRVIDTNFKQTQPLRDEQGNEAGTITVGGSISGVTVTNTSDCDYYTCFPEKFSECSPVITSMSMMDVIEASYEILGPKNGGCEVKLKYIKNTNPEWVGKEMTCIYDNSKEFDQTLQEVFANILDASKNTCSGSLYEIMIRPPQ